MEVAHRRHPQLIITQELARCGRRGYGDGKSPVPVTGLSETQ
jgi:hypothetical protein